MSETKHTPGPFHVVLNGIGGQDATCSSYNIVNAAGQEIAKVETCNYDDTEWDNWDADRPSLKAKVDAQFVAAALNAHDDMLAALEAVAWELDNPASRAYETLGEYKSSMIRAAIAKALIAAELDRLIIEQESEASHE